MSETGRLALHGGREGGRQEERSQLTTLISIGSVPHSSFYRLLLLVNPLNRDYQEFQIIIMIFKLKTFRLLSDSHSNLRRTRVLSRK